MYLKQVIDQFWELGALQGAWSYPLLIRVAPGTCGRQRAGKALGSVEVLQRALVLRGTAWGLWICKNSQAGICSGQRRRIQPQVSVRGRPAPESLEWMPWFPTASPKHHQLGGLVMIEIYFLRVLEAGCLKSRCQKDQILSENSSFLSFLVSVVAGNPWRSLALRGITPSSAPITYGILCVSVCPNFPLLMNAPVTLDYSPNLSSWGDHWEAQGPPPIWPCPPAWIPLLGRRPGWFCLG